MHKKILRLALPSIVSNITVPLLGLVDVAITGHMGSASYMAAIAVGSMVFNIMYWLFAFLRFGTGGMTAQCYGAGDKKECCNILLRAHVTCALCAAVILILQVPLFQLAMWVIDTGDTIVEQVETYYYICIWGVLPSLALYAFNGWFVGMQNTKWPMVVSITQNIVNIALSCFFVYALNMKIEGVAMGTVSAQWCGAVMAMLIIRHYYGALWKDVKLRGAMKLQDLRRFFGVNRILFYRTLFLVSVNIYFIIAGAKGGAEILSVNNILMQMFILYTYVMDGFAFAAEALCGRFYGARDKKSFNIALRGIWLWALLLTTAYTITYAAGGDAFLRLLTNEPGIIATANDYLPWAIAIPFCGIAAFVWDGVFVGITNTKGMLAGTSVAAITFFIIYFALYPTLHNHALWLAFNAYLLMRGIVEGVIYKMHNA